MRKARDVLVILSPVSQPRLAGIARCAKERGWNLMVQDRLRHPARGWSPDGVLATVRAGSPIAAEARRMKARGVPLVDLTCEVPGLRVTRVASDHRAIGRLAAEHFDARNFRSRAWFSNGWSPVHALRYAGFTEACPARRWIGAERVERAPKPLAVLAYDETDAAWLLRVCLARGIAVPEEVAILSIGNDPLLSEMQPVTVSSIDQDLERGGYEAAAALDRLMADPSGDFSARIQPKGVVVRQSTDALAVEDEAVRKAVLFIRDNLARPHGAEQVAAAVGLTRSQVDKRFAAALGRSVGAEILRQRLARVKELLKTTDRPASDLAEEVGFCSPSHLNNVFRRATGLTPRAWRRL